MCLCTEHRLYILVFSLQLPDRAMCIDQRSPVQPVRGSASPSELRSVLGWAPLVSQLAPRLAFPAIDLVPQKVRKMWKLDVKINKLPLVLLWGFSMESMLAQLRKGNEPR